MNDIFTTTFEKHKTLFLESLEDYNWEEKVDWTIFDTTEDNSGEFEKLLGISESTTPTTPPTPLIVSVPTGDWWKSYNDLPEPIKRTAIERYKLFLKDPKDPSLHFKPLRYIKGNYWSININANYRSGGIKTQIPNGFKIVWVFVGNHNQYEAWYNSLPR